MIEFSVVWDGFTLSQFLNFGRYTSYQRRFHDDLAEAYGVAGVAHIKPETKGNGKWQPSTGKTAAGIDYEVSKSGSGFTVNFVGRNQASNGGNIANWLDVGNFPPSKTLQAASYGLKAFPISGRVGQVDFFLAKIHGMGHSSKEYPKHFSDSGVIKLERDTPNIAEQAMQDFLDRLVL